MAAKQILILSTIYTTAAIIKVSVDPLYARDLIKNKKSGIIDIYNIHNEYIGKYDISYHNQHDKYSFHTLEGVKPDKVPLGELVAINQDPDDVYFNISCDEKYLKYVPKYTPQFGTRKIGDKYKDDDNITNLYAGEFAIGNEIRSWEKFKFYDGDMTNKIDRVLEIHKKLVEPFFNAVSRRL